MSESELKTPIDAITDGQHGALALMAIKYQGQWREMLKHYWWTGKDDNVSVWTDTHVGQRVYPIGAYLRQVRNQHGAAEFLDNLPIADTAQVFEVHQPNYVGGPYFVFNSWFRTRPEAYDEVDRRMLDVLEIGHTMKLAGGETLVTRRL